jgi:predicted dehydrogenase
MKTLRFGLIGCGMMGREFASAAARWFHLPDISARPEIVAICHQNLSAEKDNWFKSNVPTIKQVTDDYRELLDNCEVEAVYISVPHNLHREFYCAALDAGKHLMGEKPFGMDKKANDAIMVLVINRLGTGKASWVFLRVLAFKEEPMARR